jgi:hypothetical protein
MKFKDIKQFKRSYYKVDTPWNFLEKKLADWGTLKNGLELNPDFQRGHVWNKEQQIKYVEFILRNGASGRDIYFNCAGWMGKFDGTMYLVDGLQRITAARSFMDNKIKAFGQYFKEFGKYIPDYLYFSIHVNDMRSKDEILEWYVELNEGGVVHTEEEIKRVKKMIKGCKK